MMERNVVLAGRRAGGWLTGIAVVAILASMSEPADAGTNGQQISFCAHDPSVPGAPGGFAVATGTNQDGKVVPTHKIKLRGHGNCENLPNWWYHGLVTIKWYDYAGNLQTTTHCAVPTVMDIEGQVVKKRDWMDCDDVPVHGQLVHWIYQEISDHVGSKGFKKLQADQRSAVDRPAAILAWYELVKPGGPWDQKARIAKLFGGRAYELDPARGAYYFQWNERDLLAYDFWSNFHYGYVGRAAGFSEDCLSQAAQLGAAGGTDRGDILSVQMGLDFYQKYGSHVTPAAIAEFLDEHRAQLLDKGVAKPIDRGNADTGKAGPTLRGKGGILTDLKVIARSCRT